MEWVGSIIVVVGLGTGFELKAGYNEMQGWGWDKQDCGVLSQRSKTEEG